MTRTEKPASVKAEETRERIFDAALRLFRDKGFDATTMRDIAAEAGMAVGAAYYYFRSKEELVMAFYVRSADEARDVIPALIDRSRDLKKRIRAILDQKFEQFEANRPLLKALVRIGIDPRHPLSPFGTETAPMRDETIAYFRQAIEGSSTKIPDDLRPDLPRLLFLYQMGLVLFWLFDDSDDQRRTKRLEDATLDIIARLIQLAALPLVGPLRKRVVALLRSIEE